MFTQQEKVFNAALLSRESLPKVNFSGANLRDIDLGEQFLEGVNFSEANLENVCF